MPVILRKRKPDRYNMIQDTKGLLFFTNKKYLITTNNYFVTSHTLLSWASLVLGRKRGGVSYSCYSCAPSKYKIREIAIVSEITQFAAEDMKYWP